MSEAEFTDRRAHERITQLGMEFSQHLRVDHAQHELLQRSIEENTKMTQELVTNTTELVALVKGAKSLRKLILFWAPLFASIAALVAYVKTH